MSAVRPIVVAIALACLASACGWNDDVDSRVATAGLPDLQQVLEAHEWVLDRSSSTPIIALDGRSVTIAFRGDTVSGQGPCNTYRGSVSIDDDRVEIADLASTSMACEDAEMEAEAAYFDALEAVQRADVNNDDDRLTLEGDEIELRYRSFDADEVLVGKWLIVNVATDDAISSTVTGTEPTVTFDEDGDLALVTTCNNGSSSWALEGNELTIDPVRQTQELCPEPEGAMDQEGAITAALESATRIELTPDGLTILDRGGLVVLVATKTSKGSR